MINKAIGFESIQRTKCTTYERNDRYIDKIWQHKEGERVECDVKKELISSGEVQQKETLKKRTE